MGFLIFFLLYPFLLFAGDNSGILITVFGSIIGILVGGLMTFVTKTTNNKIDSIHAMFVEFKTAVKNMGEKIESIEWKVDQIVLEHIERFNFLILLDKIEIQTHNIIKSEPELSRWIDVKNELFDDFVKSVDTKLSGTEQIDVDCVIEYGIELSAEGLEKGKRFLGTTFVDLFYMAEHDKEVEEFMQEVRRIISDANSHKVKRQEFRKLALSFKSDFNQGIIAFYLNHNNCVSTGEQL